MALFNAFYLFGFDAWVFHPGFFAPIFELDHLEARLSSLLIISNSLIQGVSMKNKKQALLKLTKETPKERKERVSCGVKYRAAVFENKKKRQKYKSDYSDEIM